MHQQAVALLGVYKVVISSDFGEDGNIFQCEDVLDDDGSW